MRRIDWSHSLGREELAELMERPAPPRRHRRSRPTPWLLGWAKLLFWVWRKQQVDNTNLWRSLHLWTHETWIYLCTLATKSFKQQFKWKSGVFSFLLYFSTPFLLFRCFSRLSDSGVNPYGRVCVREKTIMASAISGSYRCLIYLLSHFPNSIAWSIFGQLCIAAHTNTKQLLIH